MADLTIVVDVENNQTISHFSVPESGKLVFRNAAASGDLVIAPKSPTTKLPFCQSNGKSDKPPVPIGPGSEDTFRICDGTTENFYYTAKIGDAIIEDPIVIVEKKQMYMLDPWTAGISGLLVGAGIAYFIVRWRDGRKRPQQG